MIYSTTTRRDRLCFELWWDSNDSARGIAVHRLHEGRPDDTTLAMASAWEHLGTTWVQLVDGRLVPNGCTDGAAEVPVDVLDELAAKDPAQRAPSPKLILADRPDADDPPVPEEDADHEDAEAVVEGEEVPL